MVFDPRGEGDRRPVVIHDEAISQVTSFKYLGAFIDNSLTWSIHTDTLCNRLQQCLHFLWRLRVHGVDQKFMLVFCHAVSDTCYCNLSVRLKSKLVRLMQTAWKVIGAKDHPPLQSAYEQAAAHKIITDPSHVLYTEYQLLPSGRRFRAPCCRLNRSANSFIPISVKLLNSGK